MNWWAWLLLGAVLPHPQGGEVVEGRSLRPRPLAGGDPDRYGSYPRQIIRASGRSLERAGQALDEWSWQKEEER